MNLFLLIFVLMIFGISNAYAQIPTDDLLYSYFTISDDLLKEIWNDRDDLQSPYGFPEVADGDFTRMKIWAEYVGWNEDERLSDFIPEGKIPVKVVIAFSIKLTIILVIILIVGGLVYSNFIRKNRFKIE